jgi:hypothetical protein
VQVVDPHSNLANARGVCRRWQARAGDKAPLTRSTSSTTR